MFVLKRHMCFLGTIIVYLIILGDIFVGTEASGYNGVLPSLLDDHSGSAWYLSRWFLVSFIVPSICAFVVTLCNYPSDVI